MCFTDLENPTGSYMCEVLNCVSQIHREIFVYFCRHARTADHTGTAL